MMSTRSENISRQFPQIKISGLPEKKTKKLSACLLITTKCISNIGLNLVKEARWLLLSHLWPLLMVARSLPVTRLTQKANHQVKLSQIHDTYGWTRSLETLHESHKIIFCSLEYNTSWREVTFFDNLFLRILKKPDWNQSPKSLINFQKRKDYSKKYLK